MISHHWKTLEERKELTFLSHEGKKIAFEANKIETMLLSITPMSLDTLQRTFFPILPFTPM